MSRAGHWAVGTIGASALGALALWQHGPFPVTHPPYAAAHVPTFFYMWMAFPYYGLVWGEIAHRFPGTHSELLIRSVLVGAVAALRLVGGVPISGHTLLLTFATLETARWGRSRLARAAWGASGLGLTWVLFVKIVQWEDLVTSSAGVAVGAVIALARPPGARVTKSSQV